MKKLIIVICTLFLTACETSQPVPTIDSNNTINVYLANTGMSYDRLNIYTYRGCEYLIIGAFDRRMMTHMGDCKNPIHKR